MTTALDSRTGAIFARNKWSAGFGSRVAFADFSGRQTDWTGDRREFIGRNGTLAQPAAMASGAALSNALGAGLDPCAAGLLITVPVVCNNNPTHSGHVVLAQASEKALSSIGRQPARWHGWHGRRSPW